LDSSVIPAPPLVLYAPTAPPFSAGRVIGRSFATWFANFVPFSAIAITLYLPDIVLSVLVPEPRGPGWDLLDLLLSSLARLVVTGALTLGVLKSLRGERAPVGALFGTGFRTMGSVFAVSFRVGLWLLLGTVLLVVPALLWYCVLFVAVPAAVVEPNLGSSADALERSRVLTRGNRWGILAILLVDLVVTVAVVVATSAFAALASVVPRSILIAASSTVIVLVSSFSACTAAVAYNDLRVSKEGVSTADLVRIFVAMTPFRRAAAACPSRTSALPSPIPLFRGRLRVGDRRRPRGPNWRGAPGHRRRMAHLARF